MKTGLLLTRFDETDAGCIFLEKFSRYFFNEHRIIELQSYSKKFAFYSRIINSPIFKLIKKTPFGPIINWLIGKFFARFFLKEIIINVENKYTTLILPTGDELAFILGLRLKKMGYVKKLHLMILDFPWTYENSKLNNWIIKKLYLNALRDLDSADCISDEMLDATRSYNSSIKLYHNSVFFDLHSNIQNSSAFLEEKTGLLEIAYAGNLRFRKEIFQFLEILALGTPRFKFHLFSKSSITLKNVENRGFQNSNLELINELRNFDFGFIPLSFDKKDEEMVRTSFPSKTATYLSAQLPIVAFAPEYSALVKFINNYGLGIVIGHKGFGSRNILNELKQIRKNWDKNIMLLKKDNLEHLNQLKTHFQ